MPGLVNELNPRFQFDWVPLGSICQRSIGYALNILIK